VVRLPAMQIFASSLKTSAVVVAALLRDLKEPSKSKGVEIDSAAVDELIAELASSPKRDSSSTLKGLQSGSSSAVPSGPRALAKVKQTVELDDSLAFSMTASERGSKEISFSLTATEELKPSPSVPSEGGRRSGQTVGSTGFGASQDHHALRDVLTDAASARSRSPSTEGGTRRAPRTGGLASQDPHALHVLGDALPPRSPSPHQATEAIGKRRGSPAGTGGLAASQDQHALRD
ncbi:DNA polymerase I A, partial [Durusdinium trenchii]